jgi:hypothetical protein
MAEDACRIETQSGLFQIANGNDLGLLVPPSPRWLPTQQYMNTAINIQANCLLSGAMILSDSTEGYGMVHNRKILSIVQMIV